MQSLIPIHCFLFEIQIIKNDFTGPVSYRSFEKQVESDRPAGWLCNVFLKRATVGGIDSVPRYSLSGSHGRSQVDCVSIPSTEDTQST